MKTNFNIVVSVALLGLLNIGCNPASKPVAASRIVDVEAIRQADLAWSAAQELDGLDGTMSFYVDEPIFMPPNSPMVIGKEAG